VATQFNALARDFELLSYFKPLLFFLRYILIWVSLTILYLIFPNTKVKIFPAVVAGILAGTAYELVQLGWIQAQVFLSRYNAIYGSFAALPLFLIWLQLSWTIVLFGCEYAYATQNANLWQHDLKSMKLSNRHRWEVTFLVLRHIIKNFEAGQKALNVSELSAKVHIPYRFVRDVCLDLVEAGVLNQVSMEDDTEAYQPAIDIAQLDIYTVMSKVNRKGFNSLKTDDDEIFKRIENAMMELDSSIKSAPSNRLIKQL